MNDRLTIDAHFSATMARPSAQPLEMPLCRLPSNATVWVVRNGLVLPYPAQLLRDIANDRYVTDGGPEVSENDYDYGQLFARHLKVRNLTACSRDLWLSAAPGGRMDAFDLWWESVDPHHSATSIGAAIVFAARNVLTVSLFSHRYGIDIRAMNA